MQNKQRRSTNRIVIILILATAICFLKSCVPAGVWLKQNLALDVEPDTLLISNDSLSYDLIFSGNTMVLTLVDSIVVELLEKESDSKIGTAVFYGRPDLLGEPPMAFKLKKRIEIPLSPDIRSKGVNAKIILMRDKRTKKLRFKEVAWID